MMKTSLWLTVIVVSSASIASGQLTTIGKRVAQYRAGLEKRFIAHEFRVQRATEELAGQAKLTSDQLESLTSKNAEVLEAQKEMVRALLEEAETKFDQNAGGNRPLGGPFKDLSDLLHSRAFFTLETWLDSVSSVLTEQQQVVFKTALNKRQELRVKSEVSSWVVEIDKVLFLSNAQRDALQKELSEWYRTALRSPNPPRILSAKNRPALPMKVLGRALDANELKAWDNHTNNRALTSE